MQNNMFLKDFPVVVFVELSQLYQQILQMYGRLFKEPEKVLEKHLLDLMNRGYSFEEALHELYKRAYAYFYLPSLSIGELFKISWNRFKRNPALAVPILLSEAAPALTTLIILIVLFALIQWFQSIGIYSKIVESLVEGKYEILGSPGVFELIIAAITTVAVSSLLLYALGISMCDSFLYTLSEEALKRGSCVFENVWGKAVKVLPRMFLTNIAKGLAIYGVPVVGLVAFILYTKDSPTILILGILTLLLIAIVYIFLLQLALIYVTPSIVIGSKRIANAFLESFSLFKKTALKILAYFIIQVAVVTAVSLITAALNLLNVLFSEAATLAILLVVRPVFSLCLAGMYMAHTNRIFDVRTLPEPRLSHTAVRLLVNGFRELCNLARDIKWITAASLVFIAGFAGGYWITTQGLSKIISQFVGLEKGGIVFERYLPVSIFADIFFHNWRIAAFTSVSGVYSIAAPATIVLVNGIILGAVAAVLPFTDFYVAIMPHGIVEIPGFILAAAAGMRLAYQLLARKEKASYIKRAAYIALGLAPFFAVAAFIETFITPFFIKLYLKSL